MTHFFEKLFFAPKWYHYLVAVLLLPLSFLYGLAGFIKRVSLKPKSYTIPIVSIGNIVVGGSGKTPFAIALIKYLIECGYSEIVYISRGYGRLSKGLVIVKEQGNIECDVTQSGDEAMLVALSCNCSVIVSEDRVEAIEIAKKRGAKIVILDDAFSKARIEKLDILLEPPELKNHLVLPSGPLREFYFTRKRADLIVKEGVDFERVVSFENLSERMLLATSIANPSRLEPYLPCGVVESYYLPDHSYFNKDILLEKMRLANAKTLLVTQKDYVKLKQFKLPLSVMKLKLEINLSTLKCVEKFIKERS